jgi:hypothetical protein
MKRKLGKEKSPAVEKLPKFFPNCENLPTQNLLKQIFSDRVNFFIAIVKEFLSAIFLRRDSCFISYKSNMKNIEWF